MRVLDVVEGMVRAADGCLQVTQQGVDGLELRQLHAGLAAAGDHGPVLGDAEAKDGPLVGRPDGLGDRVVAPAPHKDVAVRVPSEQVA